MRLLPFGVFSRPKEGTFTVYGKFLACKGTFSAGSFKPGFSHEPRLKSNFRPRRDFVKGGGKG